MPTFSKEVECSEEIYRGCGIILAAQKSYNGCCKEDRLDEKEIRLWREFVFGLRKACDIFCANICSVE